MRIPFIPFPVRIPVAHVDRPPEGVEADLFTYHPASEWDEHWVPVDVPAARAIWNELQDSIERLATSGAIALQTYLP